MQSDSPTLFIVINETHYVFAVGLYSENQNFKIIEKITIPNKGTIKNKIVDIKVVEEIIKSNVQEIEKKINCIFKEVTIILGSFDFSCINISGFKKLNGSQVLKENISYILNSLKSAITKSEKEKKILHIFNSKSILDGTAIDNLPIGLFGDFYSHELTFFLISNNDYKNFKKIFNKNNLDIKRILVKNFIEGVQLINQKKKIEKFFKIKIDKNSSSLSFFENSSFRYEQYFNFGTNMILKDILKVCSISHQTIEKILSDKYFMNKKFKDDELLEKEYFIYDNYRKIRKKLIKDIANARIEEMLNIILIKNINLNFFKKINEKVYLHIEDRLIFDNFTESFNFFLPKEYNCELSCDNDNEQDSLVLSAEYLLNHGWKKEAIPVTQTKNSLITRIFNSLFN